MAYCRLTQPQTLRCLDALIQVLERGQIAIRSKEDLGEVFEGLQVPFGRMFPFTSLATVNVGFALLSGVDSRMFEVWLPT